MGESFKKFWSWVNQRTILPWVVIVLTAVYGFSQWESSTHAQGVQIQEVKAATEKRIDVLKEDVARDQDALRDQIIYRLDDLKSVQNKMDSKLDTLHNEMDRMKDQQRDLGSDLRVVCDKVNARCRQ